MTFTHRPLEDKDAEVICSFAQTDEELFFAFPGAAFPLTSDQLITAAKERHDPTVVLLDDAVVGYANFIEAKKDRFCLIGNLMVHPEFRRKGVATYLVKAMLRKGMEKYCTRFVRASCFSHNQKAYQLYHKLGFRPGEMEQRVTSDGTPVLLVNLYLYC